MRSYWTCWKKNCHKQLSVINGTIKENLMLYKIRKAYRNAFLWIFGLYKKSKQTVHIDYSSRESIVNGLSKAGYHDVLRSMIRDEEEFEKIRKYKLGA